MGYGWVSRGDAQKNQFWSGRGMFSRGTGYSTYQELYLFQHSVVRAENCSKPSNQFYCFKQWRLSATFYQYNKVITYYQ